MTNIDLDDKEAKLFLLFREHQELVATLVEAGIFTLRDGSITVNFGHNGQATVEIKQLFKVKTDKVLPIV